ncbi:MAG: hypothetical protein NZT92_04965 [Abditibacteriales bacterium]|nr:hypothetical protein [Abditibacteriales bacterium]MDW8365310.1 hypothetical protein [Abditibacteriales bacterium]
MKRGEEIERDMRRSRELDEAHALHGTGDAINWGGCRKVREATP